MKRLRGLFEEKVSKALETGYGAWLVDVRDRLRRNEFMAPIPDAIFQLYGGHQVELVDAYGFAEIWAMLRTGEAAAVTIDIGVGPTADRYRKENQEALVRALKNPQTLDKRPDETAKFEAWVDQKQNHATEDGSFSWFTPITMSRGGDSWVCEPWSLPLEIGYTAVETTWRHLALDRGVARWPYGSTCVTLLFMPETMARSRRML